MPELEHITFLHTMKKIIDYLQNIQIIPSETVLSIPKSTKKALRSVEALNANKVQKAQWRKHTIITISMNNKHTNKETELFSDIK